MLYSIYYARLRVLKYTPTAASAITIIAIMATNIFTGDLELSPVSSWPSDALTSSELSSASVSSSSAACSCVLSYFRAINVL